MKTNSKGFTLIELLAVIVILAVIALIATPLIMGVIDDARKGSAKNGAYGYVKAFENTVATEMIKDTKISPDATQTTVGKVVFDKRNNDGSTTEGTPANGKPINFKGTSPDRHHLSIVNGTVGDGSCIVVSGYAFKMSSGEWVEMTDTELASSNCKVPPAEGSEE